MSSPDHDLLSSQSLKEVQASRSRLQHQFREILTTKRILVSQWIDTEKEKTDTQGSSPFLKLLKEIHTSYGDLEDIWIAAFGAWPHHQGAATTAKWSQHSGAQTDFDMGAVDDRDIPAILEKYFDALAELRLARNKFDAMPLNHDTRRRDRFEAGRENPDMPRESDDQFEAELVDEAHELEAEIERLELLVPDLKSQCHDQGFDTDENRYTYTHSSLSHDSGSRLVSDWVDSVPDNMPDNLSDNLSSYHDLERLPLPLDFENPRWQETRTGDS